MKNVVIKPRKFILIPTGTYNEQFFRPYVTNVNDYLIRCLYEKTNGGKNTSPSAVAGVAGSVLTPSNEPTSSATIKNGWNNKRYRFVMILDVTENHIKYVQIATGYTDYVGGAGKNLDPEMEVYFNSFQTFTSQVKVTPNGVKTMLFPHDITQLIKTDSRSPLNAFRYDHMNPMLEKQLLRPQDVFNRLTMEIIGSGLDYEDNDLGIATDPLSYSDVVDTRSGSMGGLSTSNRKNGNPSNYVSSVLTALKDSKEAYGDTNACNVYSEAAVNKNVADKHISSNITTYKMATTFTDFNQRGYLKLKELQMVIPNLSHVTQIVGLTQAKKVRMPHETGDTEKLSNITREAHAATILSNALPDLMIDSLLGQVNFLATNNYADGLIRFTWTDDESAKSLSEGIEAFINKFVHRLTNEVLFDLCHQGAIRFNLHVFADITDDIKITIGFDGQPPVPYVMPIFCDSIFSPIIGESGTALKTLSDNMSELANNICRDD